MTALIHRPPKVAVLGTVMTHKLSNVEIDWSHEQVVTRKIPNIQNAVITFGEETGSIARSNPCTVVGGVPSIQRQYSPYILSSDTVLVLQVLIQ